eukprot:TRINITY_DN121782_c0_g1_i1.p1 TRINITY_DN121782_c0_g1~~TRINITY_DN121782_c0_g1_i1.p1  ORF type:complete len:241 (-),score=42.74 TRINITY_DN121782_c0_g1_i1:573-1295(-)
MWASLMPRLVNKAPTALWDLLKLNSGHEGSWMQMAVEDCCWAYEKTDRLEDLGSPREDLNKWENFCRSYPNQWCEIIRKLEKTITQDESEIISMAADNADIDDVQDDQDLPCRCITCNKNLPNKQALRMHAITAHGRRANVSAYSKTNKCVFCCKKYKNTKLLQAHLRYGFKKYGPGSCLGQAIIKKMTPHISDETFQSRGVTRDGDAPTDWHCGPLPKDAYTDIGNEFTAQTQPEMRHA